VTPVEPQSAKDYGDRVTAAVKSVLVEIGQILGAFKGKFAVIGGAVPCCDRRTDALESKMSPLPPRSGRCERRSARRADQRSAWAA
jgi:hypothetical protein